MDRHRFVLAVVLLFVSIVPTSLQAQPSQEASAADCAASYDEAIAAGILDLESDAFDQDLDGGWRPIADAGCHASAARLLDEYVDKRPQLIGDPAAIILYFHAGQMYAFAGEDRTAVERFANSRYDDAMLAQLEADDGDAEMIRALQSWNAYVGATVAFLQRDLVELRRFRDHLAANSDIEMNAINLKFVERFLKHPGRSYREVYSGEVDDPAEQLP